MNNAEKIAENEDLLKKLSNRDISCSLRIIDSVLSEAITRKRDYNWIDTVRRNQPSDVDFKTWLSIVSRYKSAKEKANAARIKAITGPKKVILYLKKEIEKIKGELNLEFA